MLLIETFQFTESKLSRDPWAGKNVRFKKKKKKMWSCQNKKVPFLVQKQNPRPWKKNEFKEKKITKVQNGQEIVWNDQKKCSDWANLNASYFLLMKVCIILTFHSISEQANALKNLARLENLFPTGQCYLSCPGRVQQVKKWWPHFLFLLNCSTDQLFLLWLGALSHEQKSQHYSWPGQELSKIPSKDTWPSCAHLLLYYEHSNLTW